MRNCCWKDSNHSSIFRLFYLDSGISTLLLIKFIVTTVIFKEFEENTYILSSHLLDVSQVRNLTSNEQTPTDELLSYLSDRKFRLLHEETASIKSVRPYRRGCVESLSILAIIIPLTYLLQANGNCTYSNNSNCRYSDNSHLKEH